MATVSSTSSSQSGLACDTSYFFGVEAFDAAGNRSARVSVNPKTGACPSAPPPDPTILLDEEFDSLDSSRWQKKWWWNGDQWGNDTDEIQAYRDYNVSIENGMLALSARKENVVDFKGRARSWSSGMVQTNGIQGSIPRGFTFTFGRVEARIKMSPGVGMWPSMWLCDDRYSSPWCDTEMDIVEWLGRDPMTAFMSYHWRYWAPDHVDDTNACQTSLSDDLSAGFHTYALDWRSDSVVWYLDGVECQRYEGPEVPRNPHYIILTLAIGGQWGGFPDSSTPSATKMLVDYVRVTA